MKATIQLGGGEEIVVDGLIKIKYDSENGLVEVTAWDNFIFYSNCCYIFIGSSTFTTWGKNILFIKFEN